MCCNVVSLASTIEWSKKNIVYIIFLSHLEGGQLHLKAFVKLENLFNGQDESTLPAQIRTKANWAFNQDILWFITCANIMFRVIKIIWIKEFNNAIFYTLSLPINTQPYWSLFRTWDLKNKQGRNTISRTIISCKTVSKPHYLFLCLFIQIEMICVYRWAVLLL